MKNLNQSDLIQIDGGIPWLVVFGVGILVAGFIDGCNESRYETTAKESPANMQPEC